MADGSTLSPNQDRKLPINYGGISSSPQREMQREPSDRLYIGKISMYLFGITCLLPWNFFIQANEYWLYKLRNVQDDDHESDLQVSFPSYLAIASKVPYVLFLLINAVAAKRILPEKRMLYPLLIMTLLFVAVVIMIPINTDEHQTVFFAITMCIVVGINVMCGFIQGGGTGIAGSFPRTYMEDYVNGMATGGILASMAQIIAIVAGSSPEISAFLYFSIALLVLCLTIVMFKVLVQTELYKFYMSKQKSAMTNRAIVWKNIFDFNISKKIWVYAVSIVALFWISLSILPAIVSLVTSASPDDTIWTDRLFLPLACFFLFNAADLGGRIIAIQFPIPARYKSITMILSIGRVVFIPLIMLCNAHPREHLPVVFDSDISFITIIFFFALSNGYLCNIILSQAPKAVDEEYQELAGTQMAFFLGLGLMFGSVTSYGLVKLL